MVHTKNYVCKRDGRKEEVHLDKITSRIQKLCYGLNMDFVEPVSITLKVINGLYPGVTTVELDSLAAETAVMMSTHHPDYAVLAARIAVSNLHKQTKKHFSDVIEDLYTATNAKTGEKTPLISTQHYSIITKNANRLNSCIIYDRDFSYNYFAFKTLEQTCLLKINGKVVERPQHMLMRVAVGIHGEDLDSAIETYNYMSEKYFIHGGATLLSAGTPQPELCSSYSLTMPDDSLDGIYDCITRCATIGSSGGGVGVSIHKIRAKGTEIAGTNGVSNGLVPMLRVFNNSACYVSEHPVESQAIYLEPWHADIMEFLSLKRVSGKDEYRARDLMYAMWIPDLFMKRVKNDEKWSLMCPHQCQGLPDCWGEEFEKLYEKYEAAGSYVSQIPARDLWRAICVSQMETGAPYILYKDSCNRKSNHQNLGTIRNGSLCAGIIQFTAPDEVAVGTTASLSLDMFVNSERTGFDFEKLKKVTKILTKNLDRIIDVTCYPIPEAQKSSLRHRPIAVGVQGLADAFIQLKLPYDSEEASRLNVQIFETIYYAALEASCELAQEHGFYETYQGSPVSRGILQHDMWKVAPTDLWDWAGLKEKIAKHGVRNSLVSAVIPTDNACQILGNSKSVEPYWSNVETKRVSSGEFQVVNESLLKDLSERGLWDSKLRNKILENEGSIQNISEIPDDLKKIYKTVWEISQKVVINMAADRGAFVDQSQAMNIHITVPSYQVMTSMHFYGWEKGLKTGMYLLKSKPSSLKPEKTKVGVKESVSNGKTLEEEEAALVCSLQNPGACEMCSA